MNVLFTVLVTFFAGMGQIEFVRTNCPKAHNLLIIG